jgi:hypothetical protein
MNTMTVDFSRTGNCLLNCSDYEDIRARYVGIFITGQNVSLKDNSKKYQALIAKYVVVLGSSILFDIRDPSLGDAQGRGLSPNPRSRVVRRLVKASQLGTSLQDYILVLPPK